MKAQRRHELRTNALDQILEDFPGFMREYGSRILLGLIICALVIMLILNWRRGKSERDVQSREAIASAREDLGQLSTEMGQLIYTGYPPTVVAEFRDNAAKRVTESLARAAETDDPKIKADAEVIRGDMNYFLASLPPLPGSDTRPSLNGDLSPDELRKNAREAYEKVLVSPLDQDHTSVRNARFSLASIAEDAGEWDKARQFYQQIIDDASVATPFKDLARERMDRLATLQKPILLARPSVTTVPSLEGPLGPFLPSTMTTQSSATQPAVTQPTTASSPGTQPAGTQP